MGRPAPGETKPTVAAPPPATTAAAVPAADAPRIRVAIADGVATITLARPGALNALDRPMREELIAAFRAAERDRAVRAILLAAEGRAFCAGQDLRETFGGDGPTLTDEIRQRYNPLILAIHRSSRPVVAAINGVAAGAGCSLALACDIRIAADNASIVLAFGKIGLVPDSGVSWFLPRLVGTARAAELALVGDALSAEEAARIGLVSRVVPADQLMEEALAAAEKIASMSRPAATMAKEAINRAFETPLSDGLNVERNLFHSTFALEDRSEGMAAFIEKRKPVNKNR